MATQDADLAAKTEGTTDGATSPSRPYRQARLTVLLNLRELFLLCGALWLVIAPGGNASAQFVDSTISFDTPISAYLNIPEYNGHRGTILVSGRSMDERNLIALYGLNENGSLDAAPLFRLEVPNRLIFFDEGRLGSESALLFAGPEGIFVLDPRTGEIDFLFEVPSIYRTTAQSQLQALDFFLDVNGDGLDDLVLRDFDGIRIAIQRDGGFQVPQLLEIPVLTQANAGSTTYRTDELHWYDFNADGRQDVAVMRDAQFNVFYAHSNGSFAASPELIPIGIEVGEDSQEDAMQTLMTSDQSDLEISSISMVKDLNQDRLPDIVTFTVTSSGLFDKNSEYRVYFAGRNLTRIYYRPEHDARIQSSGFQIGVSAVEAGPDRWTDLATFAIDFGFRQLLAALITRSFSLDVALHSMSGASLISSEPEFQSQVSVSVDLSSGSISIPAIRFGDFDGDGLPDFLSQRDDDELFIRLSTSADASFDSDVLEWETTLPEDGTRISTVDVNDDQRQDVIVTYGNADGEELQKTLRVLVSTM